MNIRESRLSARHNYLVNGMLTPGFLAGDPISPDGFYFLADPVMPGEPMPRISCRMMNEAGRLMAEMVRNRIGSNPGGCRIDSVTGGFRVCAESDAPILEVMTESFANGSLTRIKARLFDEKGELRAETAEDSVAIHGMAELTLSTPFEL